ncbi:response regulator [Mariniflexile soesokkakense]|uniref:Response regulator n=1 Tax=Mariniflexile soesokkakense TaxID=1343160 RepID=A0ABV0AI54_9FLAO
MAFDFKCTISLPLSQMVRRIKILLVEDDFEIGKWLKKCILEIKNIKSLCWETSLKQGSIAFYRYNPDIIILDLKLPDGNGINLLKEIKRHKVQCKVYVFSVNNECRKTCLRLGADAFFDKVYDSQKLINSLSQLKHKF